LSTLMLKGEEPEHLQSLSSSHIKTLELMELIHRKHMKNCFWTACLVTERTLPTGMKWHSPGNMSMPYLTFGKIKQLISRIMNQDPWGQKKQRNSLKKMAFTGGRF